MLKVTTSNFRSTYKTSRKKYWCIFTPASLLYLWTKRLIKQLLFIVKQSAHLTDGRLNNTRLSERLGKNLGRYFFEFNQKDMKVNLLWATFARQQLLSFYMKSVLKMHDIVHELCTMLKNASKTEDCVFLHDTRYLFLFRHFIGKKRELVGPFSHPREEDFGSPAKIPWCEIVSLCANVRWRRAIDRSVYIC